MPLPERKKNYIGIDNGTSGAMAELCSDGDIEVGPSFVDIVGNRKTLNIDSNLAWLETRIAKGSVFACFEQAQINPLFGAKGNYAAGAGNEFWRIILTQARIPFISVRPQEWQKVILSQIRGKKKKRKDTKTAAAMIVRQRFPNLDLSVYSASQIEGINDAICIALWAKLTNQG